jgi:hypothetical protein
VSPVQTLLLGVAGLLAAVLLGLLAYVQARRAFPRSKLRLSAQFLPSSEAGIAFQVTFRNTGRYPAFIETIAICLRDGEIVQYRSVHGLDLRSPLKVSDESPVHLLFPISRLMSRIRTPQAVLRIQATDTVGKTYSFPGRAPWSRKSFSRQISSTRIDEDQEYWEDQFRKHSG